MTPSCWQCQFSVSQHTHITHKKMMSACYRTISTCDKMFAALGKARLFGECQAISSGSHARG